MLNRAGFTRDCSVGNALRSAAQMLEGRVPGSGPVHAQVIGGFRRPGRRKFSVAFNHPGQHPELLSHG